MGKSPVIGLVGRMRSGKDSVARVLVGEYGFRRLAFADQLRTAALALDPIVAVGQGSAMRLGEYVTAIGWERAKTEVPEVRRILQNYGQAIRQTDPDFWLRPVLAGVDARTGPVVVTDVRYANEADAIEGAGGVLVRVVRPAIRCADAHVSETQLDSRQTDYEVNNTGGLADLGRAVQDLATSLACL